MTVSDFKAWYQYHVEPVGITSIVFVDQPMASIQGLEPLYAKAEYRGVEVLTDIEREELYALIGEQIASDIKGKGYTQLYVCPSKEIKSILGCAIEQKYYVR